MPEPVRRAEDWTASSAITVRAEGEAGFIFTGGRSFTVSAPDRAGRT